MFNRTGLIQLLIVIFVFAACKDKSPGYTVPSDPKLAALQLPEGFRAERLFGPSENEEGSWVAMTFDNKGRLIASDQYGGLYRMTIPVIGDTVNKVVAEPLRVDNFNFGYAHGLLYAFNSLYVMVNHGGDSSYPKSSGLYRLQDTNNDDQYDSVTLLKALEGEGEHGPHSIVLAPDQQSLFVIAGNFTRLPEMKTYRSSANAQLDNLIPLLRDPNGHDNTVGMLGGWIAKVDSTGKDWELYASGFRNPFDLAFNDAGDMFTYDSDMEWDMGTPWYRPTRICHVTSGSELGWRPGTAKWHSSFSDSRPAVLNIGQGSPTNMVSGKDAAFPEKYRQALFAFDWSFGIIYAIWPTPSGSTYTAKGEEFVSGSPLPLTDGVIGPDGALYFLTGGRRLESDLYRVYYGDGHLKKEELAKPELSPENSLRRQLEGFHVNPDDKGRELAWSHLDHADAGIRFAARKILERSPLNTWKPELTAATEPAKLVQATLALAKKTDTKPDWTIVKNILNKIPFREIDRLQQLDLIRAVEIMLSRSTKPDERTRNELVSYFGAYFPLPKEPLYNRQLSKVLVYLEDSSAIKATVQLMLEPQEEGWVEEENLTSSADLIMRNPDYGMGIAGTLAKFPPQNQTYYATVLSQVKSGMNESLMQDYFSWFTKAFQFQGGHSYAGFINLARKQALNGIPRKRFDYFNNLSGDSIANRPVVAQSGKAVQPEGPGRNWTVEDAMKYVDSGMSKRNFERGQGLFVTSLCASCHTMKGDGGVSGPDLTQLGTRFSYRDMLEAIIEPSKSISDQYGATVFYLRNGKTIMGRLIEEDENVYTIAQNPFAPQEHRTVSRTEVVRTRLSEISPMLPNMVNRLNAEELKDLLAYLKTGGNREDSLFSTKK
ncbi:MAG: c-type cytochrome [Flavipsychrobacter sp.]|jgi:putative heme-binding domain-containing protein|nr:c-type cytochrome [Flavipsychrobacter sp.]